MSVTWCVLFVDLRSDALLLGGSYGGGGGVRVAAPGVPAGNERGGRKEQDGGDDGLRPEAVDAPFLDNVGLEIGEHGGEEEADLGEFEGDPEAA